MKDNFLCNLLDQMIDFFQHLAVQVYRMPWQEIENSLGQRLASQVKVCNKIDDLDLFEYRLMCF